MSASSRPSPSPDWDGGDSVLLREIFRGRLWTARPATVAAVHDDLVAVYLAPGTIFKVPADTSRDDILERLARGWELRDHEWTRGRTLHLLRPGVAHAIHLWWLSPDWRFGGWYINLQEPIRPTPLGFDFMDHVLDVVIDPDLSWRWKDEEELEEAVRLGLLTRQAADGIRAEGERVIAQLEACCASLPGPAVCCPAPQHAPARTRCSMSDCIFCDIVAGEAPASFVHRDELVSAFLDIRPVTPGHMLVIPNEHVTFTHDLPDTTAERLFAVARRLARTLRRTDGVRADGVNVFVADGEAAEQEVFHAHLHVIPRFPGDGFEIDAAAWRHPVPTRETFDAIAARSGDKLSLDEPSG